MTEEVNTIPTYADRELDDFANVRHETAEKLYSLIDEYIKDLLATKMCSCIPFPKEYRCKECGFAYHENFYKNSCPHCGAERSLLFVTDDKYKPEN